MNFKFNRENAYNRDLTRGIKGFFRPDVEEVIGDALRDSTTPGYFAIQDISLEEKRKKRDDDLKKYLENVKINTRLAPEIIEKFETFDIEISGCPEEPDAPLVHGTVLIPPVEFKKPNKKPALLFCTGGGLHSANYETFKLLGG